MAARTPLAKESARLSRAERREVLGIGFCPSTTMSDQLGRRYACKGLAALLGADPNHPRQGTTNHVDCLLNKLRMIPQNRMVMFLG